MRLDVGARWSDRPLDDLALRRAGRAARVLLLALRPPDRRRGRAGARRARGRRRAALRVGDGRRDDRRCSRSPEPARRSRSRRAPTSAPSVLLRALAPWGVALVEFDQTGAPPDADIVWVESPANPTLTLPDWELAARAPGPASSATRRSRRPSTCARSTRAPTSSSTRRRSSSPATTTRCSARRSRRDASSPSGCASCAPDAGDHRRPRTRRPRCCAGSRRSSARMRRHTETATEHRRSGCDEHPAVETSAIRASAG